jgi:dihydroorotate dehydrogenase electron transfer subunit
MKKDSRAQITRKESWGEYFLLSMESPAIARNVRPGQFLMVRVSKNTHPLLRRPFSIFSAEGKTVEIFFQKVGLGTELLSEKQVGDTIDILGPLGTGFTVKPENHDKQFALIGGGRGIAPIYFLSQKLKATSSKPRIFYGGKSLQDLPIKERFETTGFSLCCTTEDGSYGTRGLITDIFEAELNKGLAATRIYACGPELMLKKIAEIAANANIPAEVSLESMMGCGFGVCWGCVKKIKKNREIGWHKICEEGPVLTAEDIIWELGNNE